MTAAQLDSALEDLNAQAKESMRNPPQFEVKSFYGGAIETLGLKSNKSYQKLKENE